MCYRGENVNLMQLITFCTSFLLDKKELLQVAKANAMKILGVENLELPKSVKSILSEQSKSKRVSTEPMVRQDPEKALSQVGFFKQMSVFLNMTLHTKNMAVSKCK